MNAKEYFRQISRMESLISTKKQHVDALKTLAYSIGAPNLSGMPKNPSGSISPMADAVCKALDLEAEIRKDEYLLQEKKVFILELIRSIENCDCQAVLIKRYFDHRSWDDIAVSMFYSTRWIYKLHGRALEEIDRKLKEGGVRT
ncbi:hypothetical protein [Anaerocolumna sp. MB42-C2]|uniref:hypothetical protein n=1 Tax=Anaerocolumna sp. MB42-C2 TaxID=3070997 RepID=UPI0027DFDB44|nr:hypothetical protein [Anaerocolumna sp. MB42-C2]WMJ87772.1 hypothetical protein RBU59_27710 [Anaerocolumna sp. MB42-C2]